ncbi:MAG: hypothetical protein OEW02_07640 [Myxococcales bacterium]|nr:hypothetical protein [Myxococcales bacterium]MDH5566144.1 hypothetical protein [Myxococcales bacterium]
MHDSRSMRFAGQRVPLAAELLLLLAVAGAVAGVAYLPTHDGPQHIFTVHAANHLEDPQTGWGRWFEPNLPLSSYGFAVVFAPLDAWLPWDLAARGALALMVFAWALGAFVFVRAVRPERSWLGVALGAASLQWSLYMGFFSFYFASAFGLFVLAFAVASDLRDARSCAILSILLLIEALLHVMAAALTGIAVLALLAFHADPGRRVRQLARGALLGAPAAGIAAGVLWMEIAAGGSGADGASEFVHESPAWWTLGRCLMPGPAWRAWPLTLLASAALVLGLVSGCRGRSAVDRALLAAGGLLLAAAALLPLHLEVWHFFSVRFTPLAVCVLVATLPIERLRARRARCALGVALGGFAFAASGWAYEYHRDLAARSREALAGLEAPIVRSGPRLPIVLDPFLGRPFESARALVPYAVPLLNLGKLYAVSQGGVVPYAFVSDPALHPLRLREDARAALPSEADPRYPLVLSDPRRAEDLALREAVTVYMAAQATRFEDVIFYGRPADVEHLAWLGFHLDWRRDGLAIARFEGCPLAVHIRPQAALGAARTLELGWFPALGTTHRYPLSRGQHAPDGTFVLAVRQSCGAVWIRFDAPGLACEGADAEGRFVIRQVRSTPQVECRIGSFPRAG